MPTTSIAAWAGSARLRGRSEATSTNFDIYRVPVDGSAAPVNLTPDNPAWDAQPAYSPDGSLLAHLAMERAGFEADRFRLVVRDAGSGAIRFTTRDWDRSVAGFRFSPDGREVYAVADDFGQRPLFSINLGSGERRKLTGAGYVTEFEVAGKRIVYGLQNLSSPADLYQIDGSGPSRQVTNVNATRLTDVRFGDYEQFTLQGRERRHRATATSSSRSASSREEVPGRVPHPRRPAGHRSTTTSTTAGTRRPTPAPATRVVIIDFHGSTGYGQAFTDAISGDWGGKPLEDLQKGLAAALAKYPWLDGDRACALGASYGGYMINWIAGNWPDRFKCLVSHDGIFDQRMMYYVDRGAVVPRVGARRARYWEKPEALREVQPGRTSSSDWKTPMLVIHGELDFRVRASVAVDPAPAVSGRVGKSSRGSVCIRESNRSAATLTPLLSSAMRMSVSGRDLTIS